MRLSRQRSQRAERAVVAPVACLAACFWLLVLAAGQAAAEAGAWAQNEQSQVRLISREATSQALSQAPDGTAKLHLGLQFQMQPGWKIYWRSPGDAGYPPSLDWGESENLASAEVLWPLPHRFSLFGLETFGYGGEVVLPIEVAVVDPSRSLSLRAKVDYLICEEICIPYSETVGLDLPAGPAGNSRHGFLIDSFRALVPGDGSDVGLRLEEAVLAGTLEAPRLEVTLRSDVPLEAPDVLVEGPAGFGFGKPLLRLADDRLSAELHLATTNAPEAGVLEGKLLRLTLTDGRRGMEKEVVARFTVPPAPPPVAWQDLALMLAFALAGGLILNLMPCVLPVLSIKLLAVADKAGRDRSEVRISFLASAAGVLFAFLLLATAAVAVKAAGMTVGWGVQFQEPLFLSAMALLVTLFACNLFGFFEIALPASLAGIAGTAGPRRGLAAHFATGAFATLLATPCSAPFLGTAVGFALSRGAAEIYVIFAALGIGLALPYLAVAAFPGMATRLPRPGNWMLNLRRLLGLALVATAVWLLSVLQAQIGMAATLIASGLLIGLGLVLWGGRRLARDGAGRLATPAFAGLIALAALFLPTGLADPVALRGSAAADFWQSFDRQRIATLVSEGRVVFIDVTADWCITCQVNKAVVLDDKSVNARLTAPGVVAMRGDWTRPDARITDYLTSFGRYGIPFNAVYGPGLPDGLALGELLSVDEVMAALDRARGG